MEVRIVCAWCERVISDPNVGLPEQYQFDVRDSHGICPRCYEENEALIDSMGPETTDQSCDLGGEAG